jgi:apolipoprotein N-acyltransferase
VTIYGGLHPLLALSTLCLLCLYLALYIGGFTFLIKTLNPGPVAMPLAGACLWVGLEYIRTHALTGFPWGVLGYSQYSNLTLVQVADLTGVLGLSFLLVLCNFLITQIWLYIRSLPGRSKEKTKKGAPRGANNGRAILVIISYTLVLMSSALIYGKTRVQTIDSLIQAAPKPKIAVIQGNIDQNIKWDQSFKDGTIKKYGNLSLASLKTSPDLIIWPETALPFYYGHDTRYTNQVDEYIRKAQTHFIIGSPAFETGKENTKYYNRAYMLSPNSLVLGFYDKNHLVPFGEYVPLQEYLGFLGKITEQAGNFSPGDDTFIPLPFKNHKIGVLICFEILFPGIACEFVKNGADILTTMTNDAWFGNTSAPKQHFSIAVLRAVENRRSIVRAANTGISGFIDPNGRIIEETRLFKDAAITRPVPALHEITFYTRYPNLAGLAALVAICLGFMIKGIKNKIFRRTQK